MISFGKAPFGPVSADVVKTVGRLNNFPNAACARMLLRNSVGL